MINMTDLDEESRIIGVLQGEMKGIRSEIRFGLENVEKKMDGHFERLNGVTGDHEKRIRHQEKATTRIGVIVGAFSAGVAIFVATVSNWWFGKN